MKFGFIDEVSLRHEERRYVHPEHLPAPVYAHPGAITTQQQQQQQQPMAASSRPAQSPPPQQQPPATQQSQPSSYGSQPMSQSQSQSQSQQSLTSAQIAAGQRQAPRNVYANAALAHERNPVPPPRVHSVASYSGDRAAAAAQAQAQEQAKFKQQQQQQQQRAHPSMQAQSQSVGLRGLQQPQSGGGDYPQSQLTLDGVDLSLSQLSLGDASQDLAFHSTQSQSQHYR
jgi:hypothetical protein